MTAVSPFPATKTMFARLTARQRELNRAVEYAEAVAEAQRIIDNPRGYTDDQLRKVCGAYMAYGTGGEHYLRAKQHIDAINRRERIARNKAAQSSWAVVQEHRSQWPQIIMGGAVVATALLAATGWLG
jgi:hypothetical protein